MSGARRGAWTAFAAGVVVALGVLAALSRTIVQRERAQRAAETARDHHEDLRTVLYRMDHRIGPVLSRGLGRLDALTRATTFEPVPPRVFDLDPATTAVTAAAPLSDDLVVELLEATTEAEPADALSQLEAGAVSEWRADRGNPRSQYEWVQRQHLNGLNNYGVELEDARVGPFVQRWHEGADGARLLLARRVETQPRPSLQVLAVAWEPLVELLRPEAADLFDDVAFERIAADLPGDVSDRLTAIPARVVVPPPVVDAGIGRWTWITLGAVWLAALAAGGALFAALRAGVAYGDRHRRFTSAVTHELRTPLTTFRLYSEMLAKDMVPPDARAEYLATLEGESERLSRLVENVLAYARLEEGRGPAAREALSVDALVARARPDLERRCAAGDAKLVVDVDACAGARVRTDPDAVLQVLFNLVDNACKYGCPAPGAEVRLEARAEDGRVELRVRDDGPGVPPGLARAVFRPFERGGRDEADPAPGVGLGLALARDLAAAIGGELRLERAERGACFALRLPTAG